MPAAPAFINFWKNMMTMNNTLKDRILEYVQDHRKGNRRIDGIAEGLELYDKVDSGLLREAVQELKDEYLLFEQPDGHFETREQANIEEGYIRINRSGIGYVTREGGSSIRIDEQDQLDAMDGDTVLVKCPPWQYEGEVVKVLKRSRDHLIATYEDNGHGLKLVIDDEKLRDRHLRVLDNRDVVPVEGLKVRCQIEKYSGPMTVRVDRVIGHKDDPGIDLLSILLDHEIDPVFPDDVMEQANAIPQTVQEEELEGRTDLRDEITITIDGDDSKDFDDAVSVEKRENGWLLKVSIADVSHYVTADSPLDLEALRRGCSTYVTDYVVPMLPHVLSNGICSLNPHADRLAMTCEMIINADGTTEEYRVYPSVINSNERMTYHNVNLILEGDEELRQRYAHLGSLFEDLRDCADAIRAYRVGKGAIEFESEEAVIKVDENGRPTDVSVKERGHAERIIEDCMIAANVSVADFLKWQDIPAIYRVHEEPQAKRIKNFVMVSELMGHKFVIGKSAVYPNEIQSYLESVADTDVYPVLSKLLLRCMQKARYDAACIGHFGLAEEEYLHFTSPIRRYPDLMVHRMLRKYALEGNIDMEERLLDEHRCMDYAEQSSIRERESQNAEYACEDMKKAEYMEGHIGEVFEGIIDGVQPYGFYVQLPNTIEGLVHINTLTDDFYAYDSIMMMLIGEHSKRMYTMGMKVRVEVISADAETQTIDFALHGKNGRIFKERKEDRKTTERGKHGRKRKR